MPLYRKCNNLREIRIQKGFSGYDLQILSSVPAQAIYLIERGLKNSQAYERSLLSDALNVSEKELFPDDLKRSAEILSTGRKTQ